MPWFRRRKKDVAAVPAAQLSTEARPEHDVSLPAAPPDEAGEPTDSATDPTKPKRRRGSRGGRGRKKTSSTSADGVSAADGDAAEAAEKPARKSPARKTSERKTSERKTLSQRQERRRQSGRRREPPRRAPLPQAKRELLVSVDVGEQRVAVLEDDRVAEVYLERPERRSIAGNIYLGRVDNVLPGMEAAFVEIGLEKNGFLYVDEIVGPELERGHGRKIQDLISKGQTILVQAVKDPMKTKGARLTTQISLPGRFVVFVPQGEGLGVSRRLEDEERARLKEILRKLAVKEGGLIVRTAAEGASEEDIERDIVFLQRLWRSIQAKAKDASAPELVYQEAELPLRVTRDLFTGDFEKAYVDNDQAYKRITGYLKKTSPHMVDRVVRYKEKAPLMEHFGVEQEIKSTVSRRVDLPSGGYLVFDYAEAFTVIDVNTGRFVGSRGKNAGGRLEDTITKNNLEAVKEVVRQLRLRDIGGIIVIDFIDMANPKNRGTVEEALRTELERDRTKTYVVEISPLGLVEMTRQNVTDGPREILTNVCPSCKGDGVVISMESHAVDAERRIRRLVAGSKSKAFHIELNSQVATLLIGPGASRLAELEKETGRTLAVKGRQRAPHDHFVVLEEGSPAEVEPKARPVERGQELEVELEEAHQHSDTDAIARVDGYVVTVKDAAGRVGESVSIRIESVARTTARAVIADGESGDAAETEKPKKKTRRGSRGGRGRKKKTEASVEIPPEEAAVEEPAASEGEPEAESETPKKKTRRGTRGGRGRKRKPVESTPEAGQESPLV
ncbi:MAG TPA: Rne/Rng family ribonuclease [Gaiellaceae bacterium]|nr:Rne/Rng family ribonuclease [Gaiellaceae bacterium]